MIILYIFFGFLSGLLGGMGMGGGTLLIPLLSFLDINQRVIQSVSLTSFIPMALVSLGIHSQCGLIKLERIEYLIIPSIIAGVLGALLANLAPEKLLRICYGIFLLVFGVAEFIKVAKNVN
ncbi:MAG: TSUP family transporter [Clostridia bacterium]